MLTYITPKYWLLRVLILMLGLWACTTPSAPTGPASPPLNSCSQVWGGMDFGSGGVRLTLAQINRCEKKWVKILGQVETAVGVIDALKANRHNEIPEATQRELVKVTKDLQFEAQQAPWGAPVQRWLAVGTSVYRTAANGRTVGQIIERETGVTFQVISQQREAEVAFSAVVNRIESPEKLSHYVVWDLGGGSSQISWWHKGAVRSLSLPFGVKGFFQRLKQALNKTSDDINPMAPVPSEFRETLKKDMAFHLHESALNQGLNGLDSTPLAQVHKTVVGVGGILGGAIPEAVDSPHAFERYTYEQVAQAQNLLARQTSPAVFKTLLGYFESYEKQKKINSPDMSLRRENLNRYHAFAPANLLMVQLLMEILKVTTIEVGDSNLGMGVLLSSLKATP